ncbi:hypothetical protein [Pontibacter ruber]|uniref:SWFGD domain-containing protein n=1 Tax=Pontibacter ruber TaxID=1343895 RepID=A0ABW5CS78_9BACT|nr:hypothetical protein [Pontibacter ruber]
MAAKPQTHSRVKKQEPKLKTDMEGNDWYNRTGYTDYRNHYRGDDRHLNQNVFGAKDEEDAYRGAYRFDNTSDHHNVSTYDWNVGGMHRTKDRNQAANVPYQQNRQHDYERDWSGYYPNDRDEGRQDTGRTERNRDRDEQYRPTSGGYGTRSGESVWDKFHDEYGPDRYRGRDEYSGNTAGSLSWGYDGGDASNPDYDRRFDPFSGRIRQRYSDYDEPRRNRYNDNQDDDRY